MDKISDKCESLEMSVFAGEELTDSLKEHAKKCENCRKFLEQNKRIEEDLKNFSVCGIEDGEITKAVMERVRAEKKKRKSGFGLYNRWGTVAAVAVILTVALVYRKNPMMFRSGESVYDVTVTDEQNQNIAESKNIAITEDEENEKSALFLNTRMSSAKKSETEFDAETETESDVTGGVSYDSGEDVLVMSENESGKISVYNSEAESCGKNDETPKRKSQTYNEYADAEDETAPLLGENYSDSKTNVETATGDNAQSVENAIEAVNADEQREDADTAEIDSEEEKVSKKTTSSALGGGGGSSRANTTESTYEEDFVSEEGDRDKYDDDFHVFEGIVFLPGAENAQYNLLIANARLAQLYGESTFELNKGMLSFNGWGVNEFFPNHAVNMTYSEIKKLCENGSKENNE